MLVQSVADPARSIPPPQSDLIQPVNTHCAQPRVPLVMTFGRSQPRRSLFSLWPVPPLCLPPALCARTTSTTARTIRRRSGAPSSIRASTHTLRPASITLSTDIFPPQSSLFFFPLCFRSYIPSCSLRCWFTSYRALHTIVSCSICTVDHGPPRSRARARTSACRQLNKLSARTCSHRYRDLVLAEKSRSNNATKICVRRVLPSMTMVGSTLRCDQRAAFSDD